MGAPGFWDDAEAAARVLKELSALEAPLGRLASLESRLNDLGALLELAAEDDGGDLEAEAAALVASLRPDLRALEMDTLLSGPYDRGDAIVALHAGAGGTESQDWAQMLLRMYTRWAERHGFRVDLMDLLPGDEAGVKSATLNIAGENAYGYLRAEKGVHRLVRISPFDASGRRHTSFASVDVLPDFPDPVGVEIKPEDLKIDTFRSSGAGGQHVNKTESAVRITHLPTGIVVTCQNERSQHANREAAMRILTARLLERLEEEQRSMVGELRGEQGEIAWGNQIRSYVFQPYTLVKDHRTGFETGNVEAVMDGDIDGFLRAYLEMRAGQGIAPAGGPQ
jgi:peptide chain release factor 2